MAIPIVAATMGALLNFSLPKLWSAIGGHMKTDVDSIITELKFIEAAVQDRSIGRDISHVRRVSIEELRLLAFDFEDCIERFLRGVESGGAMARLNRVKFAGEIRELKHRSDGLRKLVLDWDRSAVEPPTSAQAPVDMGEPVKELRELLRVAESPLEMKLKVISIVGFGDLGKTLLAEQVYQERDVRNQFTVHAWVCAVGKGAHEVLLEIIEKVLQNCASTSKGNVQVDDKGKSIQKDYQKDQELLSKQAENIWDNGELGELPNSDSVQRLRACLENKRYLVVIDEVQTEELYKIISAFPLADAVESRIIVTTTIHSAATHCVCANRQVFNRTTNDKHAKHRFFRTAVPKRKDSAAMLNKCNGLPPALISTADYFLQNGELMWRFEEDYRTLCDEMKEKMNQVFVSNYESLSSLALEQCLLYFGIFPRDHHVRRNPLIRRWLAEGLVHAETVPEHVEYSCLQDVAVHNLQTLIDRNIIQPTIVSSSLRVKTCQPPPMMLNYIYRKSMTQNFITLSCGRTDQPKYVRRLSLHPNSTAANLPSDLSRLRTLAVFPAAGLAKYEATLNFADYDLLRVLDLEEWDGLNNRHLREICHLSLLKYLSLGGDIIEIPREISKLKWLETLDLRRTKIDTLPVEVIQLPSLMHLLGKFQLEHHHFKGKNKMKLEELSKDSKLERLSGFVAGKSQGFPQLLSHMVSLKKVKIWCDSSADETNLADLSIAIKEFIRGGNVMPYRSLSIDFKECLRQAHFLDSLEVRGSLASVKLRGKLRKFPQLVTQLNTIEELCLSSTNLKGHVILNSAGNLRTLKYLKLIEDTLSLSDLVIEAEQFPMLLLICFSVKTLLELPQDIKIGAMERLLSLQLLCQNLVGDIDLKRFQGLKEVALHPGLLDEKKNRWHDAASGHNNTPNILFIDPDEHRHRSQSGLNSTGAGRTSSTTKRSFSVKGLLSTRRWS